MFAEASTHTVMEWVGIVGAVIGAIITVGGLIWTVASFHLTAQQTQKDVVSTGRVLAKVDAKVSKIDRTLFEMNGKYGTHVKDCDVHREALEATDKLLETRIRNSEENIRVLKAE